MIIPPHVHKLMDADILGWHPDHMPHYWIHIERGQGLHIRLRWFGICFHFGSGRYGGKWSWALGPFKGVIYHHDEYQQWLESWLGY